MGARRTSERRLGRRPTEAGEFLSVARRASSRNADRQPQVDATGQYAANSLFFVRDGVLQARQFDPETVTLGAMTSALAEGVVVVGGSANVAAMSEFSPDGHWLAYQSDDSTRHEIYIRRFPEGTDRLRISLEGGTQVRWNPKGDEI
jgi:hypothetical protein